MHKDKSRELIARATQVAEHAYCSYSGFRVGAALQCDDGEVFTGCNIENSSYGLTICAERCALAAAISAGKRNFTAIAIVCNGDLPSPPCGACLQVISEFCREDFEIILSTIKKPTRSIVYKLKKLLPQPFGNNQDAG